MKSDERVDELLLLWEEQAEAGQRVTVAELCRDCPELAAELQRRIDALGEVGWVARLGVAEGTGSLKQPSLAPGVEAVPGYRLISPLGRGGFGQVWRAAGPGGFEVALKFLPRESRTSAVESRALDNLRGVRHPNLLNVLGTWETVDWFVVGMEVADRSLHDRWLEAREGGLPGIPAEELLGHVAAAAEGIDYLHAADIQHRDIKPHNDPLSKPH